MTDATIFKMLLCISTWSVHSGIHYNCWAPFSKQILCEIASVREMTNNRAHSFEILGYNFYGTSRRQIKKTLLFPLWSQSYIETLIYMTTNYKVCVKLKMLDSLLTASYLCGCLTKRWKRRSEYKIWSFVRFTSAQASTWMFSIILAAL